MEFNNPANGASSSSRSYVPFTSGGTSVGDGSRNGQAATGQDGTTRQPRLHAVSRSDTPLISDDDAKAAEWYGKAARQGLPEAQFSLGYCYWHGMGVDKDRNQATQWFRRAKDQGHMHGNAFLA